MWIMKYCDLHCHSNFSDGSFTPQELVDIAVGAGLSAIALTDHNTLEGNQALIEAAQGRIEVCAGCEFTTGLDGQDLHLVGLFLDTHLAEINKELLLQRQRKENSNRRSIEALEAAGYKVSYDEFVQLFGMGSKNRVHIAKYLMIKGITASVAEAFEVLLADDSPYCIKNSKLDFYDMIRLIDAAGGVSVWAHPLYDVDRTHCERILLGAKAHGLDGVEVYYSSFSDSDIAFMEEMCQKYNLLPSGGSDFHGANKPDISIGVGRGDLRVPYDCYQRLKARAEEKRRR